MTDDKSLVPKLRFPGFTGAWERRKLGDIFDYEQPQPYIVKSTEYDKHFKTPVLTAGRSFILGYTDEDEGIRQASDESPVVIFDDFTTSSHFVNFPFKVKSSAMKFLTLRNKSDNIYCAFNVLQNIKYVPANHERHWISTLSDFNVQIPTSVEQDRIGIFFKQLDDLIALYQRKLSHLEQLKKGLLQKMFPKPGESYPEIRFPGFTGAWQQQKLENYLMPSSKKNSSGKFKKIDVLSVSGNDGIVNQIEFQGRSYAGNSVLNYNVVQIGDIVYTKSPLKKNPFGIIKTNKGKIGIVSTLYAVYRPNKNIYPNFVETYFNYDPRLNNYLRPLVNKGAKNDMKISKKTALSGLVRFPSYDEQMTISSFFRDFDDLITLHQRKLSHLQQLKKALLQQMFV